jgi:hypothetical protein
VCVPSLASGLLGGELGLAPLELRAAAFSFRLGIVSHGYDDERRTLD